MTRTMKELAEFLGCPLEGDGTVQVSGVASLSRRVQRTSFTWSPAPPGHCRRLGIPMCNRRPGATLPGKLLLRAAKPKLAFARAAEWLVPAAPIAIGNSSPPPSLHHRPKSRPGVAVGPYAVIEDDVQIGAGTEIRRFLLPWARLASSERSAVFTPRDSYAGVASLTALSSIPGAVIGSDGFGYVLGGRETP